MSLVEYQRALSDLAASPELCRALKADAGPVLDRWDLTDVERRRVEASIRHPGWVVNCTLWRANRLGPIYTLLARSCFVLGERFRDEVDRFWALHPRPDFMTRREVPRFAGFLRDRLAEGGIDDPYLDEVLAFELAYFELGLLPRRRITEETDAPEAVEPGTPLRLHPLVRVLRFAHEPEPLLTLLAQFRPRPYELAEGEFYLVVDGRAGSRELSRARTESGRLLMRIARGGVAADGGAEVAALVRHGLAVPAPAAVPEPEPELAAV
jgi:hypothetical protein